MDPILTPILLLASFVIGFAIAHYNKIKTIQRRYHHLEAESRIIVDEAQRKADTLLKEAQIEAKDRLFKMKSEFDAQTAETRAEIKNQEKRLIQKEENLEKKNEQIGHMHSKCPRRDWHLFASGPRRLHGLLGRPDRT